MSSLYLSEVHSINLVKWIQRAKILQADTRMRREDRMASQIGGKNTERSVDIKRRKRGASIYHIEDEEGGMRKGEVFAGVRCHEERFTEGKQSVKMTGYGFRCHWLSDVKS